MKIIIALTCLLALVYANENANVIRNEAEVNVDNYQYAYQLDNSVNVDQKGVLNGDALSVQGQHSWTSPEGESVSLQYVADENGYQVVNANPPLPTPPPIPEAIQRSLEWIANHPPAPEH